MTEPENRQCMACLFLLGMTLGVASNIHAHGGDPARIHACVRQGNGAVRFVPPDNDCSELDPAGAWIPVHWDIEGGDNDWAGAGTGSLHPSSLSDSVVVGAESASAKLHVRTAPTDGAAALRIDPRGTQGLLVDSQGNLLIGASSGSLARLTVNAEEHADAFRARVGGITHFVIKADGQTGVGTGEPSARLQVVARQGEDPFRVRLQSAQPEFIIDAHGNVGIGTHEPTDKLAVLQEGDGRAAFFSVQNPANQAAAVSAITNGTGSAVFANIINPNSTSPALFARNSGSGPAAQFDRGDVRFLNGNVGVGTTDPERKLTVRDGRHQVAIVDSDNNDKTWTLTSHQETRGVGLWEDGNQGRLVVTAGGRVGIGTTNPNHELVIQANDPAMQVRDDTSDNSSNAARLELLERAGGNFDAGAFFWWNGEANKLLIGTKENGDNTNVLVVDRATNSVGIGTQSPGNFRLAVNGAVRAKEIVVETGWSDFVFEPDYQLTSLEELESHIRKHRHLPGMPSAQEVSDRGLNLGEAESKTLMKVEELTLYIIDMHKRIKRVEEENVRLRHAVGRLANRN